MGIICMFNGRKPMQSPLKIEDISRITIWGVGLIGGSLGLALKKNGFNGIRVGLGRNIDRLKSAVDHDAVDEITTEIETGICESDLIVICTPVHLVPTFVEKILEYSQIDMKQTVITDVGSTKSILVRTIESMLNSIESDKITFVGGHPMAGSHETGVGSASGTLFENAKCILTPVENTDVRSLGIVQDMWKSVGSQPHQCSPEDHDILIGAASHLPHLIASILTNTVANVVTPDGDALDFTATGFRDTTRIAAGSPELWTGIFQQNPDVIKLLIDNFVENMNNFKNLLNSKNYDEIERILTDAQVTLKNDKKDKGNIND